MKMKNSILCVFAFFCCLGLNENKAKFLLINARLMRIVPSFTNLIPPVSEENFIFSSPFGPRLQASDNDRYDFHRGLDLPGTRGDPVYAVASGTIYKAYAEGSATYPDGGNVVIVEHTLDDPFVFRGISTSTIYTVYMHLDSFGVDATAYLTSGVKNTVTQGELIGTMGDSGTTDFVHLHFETRLGTTCSLEYQLENPTLNCAAYAFDPHINPMTFFVDDLNADDFTITFTNATSTGATIEITAQTDALIVDGVTFEVFSADDALYSATSSFNQRLDFDASSTETLDDPNNELFLVSPAAFNSSSTEYSISFTTEIPEIVWTGRDEILIRAALMTTLGEVAQVEQIVSR